MGISKISAFCFTKIEHTITIMDLEQPGDFFSMYKCYAQVQVWENMADLSN